MSQTATPQKVTDHVVLHSGHPINPHNQVSTVQHSELTLGTTGLPPWQINIIQTHIINFNPIKKNYIND